MCLKDTWNGFSCSTFVVWMQTNARQTKQTAVEHWIPKRHGILCLACIYWPLMMTYSTNCGIITSMPVFVTYMTEITAHSLLPPQHYIIIWILLKFWIWQLNWFNDISTDTNVIFHIYFSYWIVNLNLMSQWQVIACIKST